jgi:hypothetical protein
MQDSKVILDSFLAAESVTCSCYQNSAGASCFDVTNRTSFDSIAHGSRKFWRKLKLFSILTLEVGHKRDLVG